MRPQPGEVLHFSEDPAITVFRPHVATTAQQPEAYVWAVDSVQAPAYWFPRQCPRVVAWAVPETSDTDRERILGPGGDDRVHVIEYAWAQRFLSTELFAYRFSSASFRPFGSPVPHAFVSTEAVQPLGPVQPVGSLLQLHQDAGIQLRVLESLWDFWEAVTVSTLGFSGIRLRNAAGEPGRT